MTGMTLITISIRLVRTHRDLIQVQKGSKHGEEEILAIIRMTCPWHFVEAVLLMVVGSTADFAVCQDPLSLIPLLPYLTMELNL